MVNAADYSADKFDEGTERPPSQWFKFGKIGDVIKGVLISVSEQEDTYHPGEMQKVYEIEAIGGFFHNIVEKKAQDEPTELKPGELWMVGGKSIIDRNMRRCEIGQICVMRYIADFPMPGGNTAKTVEVKLGSTGHGVKKEVEV